MGGNRKLRVSRLSVEMLAVRMVPLPNDDDIGGRRDSSFSSVLPPKVDIFEFVVCQAIYFLKINLLADLLVLP